MNSDSNELKRGIFLGLVSWKCETFDYLLKSHKWVVESFPGIDPERNPHCSLSDSVENTSYFNEMTLPEWIVGQFVGVVATFDLSSQPRAEFSYPTINLGSDTLIVDQIYTTNQLQALFGEVISCRTPFGFIFGKDPALAGITLNDIEAVIIQCYDDEGCLLVKKQN